MNITNKFTVKNMRLNAITQALLMGSVALFGTNALAEEAESKKNKIKDAFEVIEVTARKKVESIADTPVAITALGSAQLDAMRVKDLTDIKALTPNVTLEANGTLKGAVNFAIRGLGVQGSVPSIEPTVGLFIDGIYMGSNLGVLLDTFDLESVEILRGPQGTLFGRNVTGGAVLVNSKDASEEFDAKFKLGVDGGGDGGLETTIMGAVGGALTDTLSARLTVLNRDDAGYFKNDFDGKNMGELKTVAIRPQIAYRPNESFEWLLKYDHLEMTGQGSPHRSASTIYTSKPAWMDDEPNNPNPNLDLAGITDITTDSVTSEINLETEDGGLFTYIANYRHMNNYGLQDVDAQPKAVFHAVAATDNTQTSHELRYSKDFGEFDIVTGVFQFDNAVEYDERRLIGGGMLTDILGYDSFDPGKEAGVFQDGGGFLDVKTSAIFGNLEYHLTDRLNMEIGLRYSRETKDAQIAHLGDNVSGPVFDAVLLGLPIGTTSTCTVTKYECVMAFKDSEDWNSLSWKLGASYKTDDDALVYASISRGFRAGGFNLRNSSNSIDPGPIDQEQVTTAEIGYKGKVFGKGTFNANVFMTEIIDMQRTVQTASESGGVQQVVRNTADGTITGFEADIRYPVTDNINIFASVGLLDFEYDKILGDITNDGVIDGDDKSKTLPSLIDMSYSVGLNHYLELSGGDSVVTNVSFSHADEGFF